MRKRTLSLLSTTALVAAGLVPTALITAAPASAAGNCSVDYTIASSWQGGFQGTVTVINTGNAINSWELTWEEPTGQAITQAWNTQISQTGRTVTASNASWNGQLAKNGSAQFGFIATGDSPTAPSQFSLNGISCSGDTEIPDPPDPEPEPTDNPTPDPTTDPEPEPTDDPSDPTQPGSSELFVDTSTQAYSAWEQASGTNKELLAKIALTPAARWIGDWTSNADTTNSVREYTTAAHEAGEKATLVAYAIPGRDCGLHSSGGVSTSEYAGWIDAVAAGIVGDPIVILEPDALAQLGDCDGQGDRVGFLAYAAEELSDAGAEVYIDAGHSGWKSAQDIAQRLQQVGLEHAAGFSLNVSNYQTTASQIEYGNRISELTGGAKFVVDTSRNGNGSNGEWCNPRGRALGDKPALKDDGAFRGTLWIKLPGESDGSCNGGPGAGQWWQEGALELARNASW
ncbi:glycoside hydrolase family 6 protein [Jonesia quinghaiensis]|uniref:glycoside hydrolase family 6 protein n=1 Tax=Jonesia quinghaiensis TaxID=262806 RepID=UPI000417E14F|nr:glycoside hydrolase family 6 protein [Jonesia quinghaiensis]